MTCALPSARSWARRLIPALALLVLVSAVIGPAWAQAPELYAWVELGPDRTVLARVITGAGACPSITLDGSVQPMTLRAAKSPDYGVLSCEATVPAGTKSASVGGKTLPLPVANSTRIAVIGDTGCRLKASADEYQACNDPKAWPFAAIAKSVAAYKPHLVLHLGDYLYRESPCPPGNKGCAGSPSGYNWPTWRADFFRPATPLLAAAPWVFVRGNHETCTRGGEGYFRFLSPAKRPDTCPEYTAPYAVSAGGLPVLVLDTSALANSVKKSQVREFEGQFETVKKLAFANAWLTMHHPLWTFRHDKDGDDQVQPVTQTLQLASKNSLPSGVRLVVTGHIHLLELVAFADRRAPQIVAGNSGTMLAHEISAQLVGLKIAGTTVEAASSNHKFGFLTAEPDEGGWLVTQRNTKGTAKTICRIEDGVMSCEAAD